MNKKRKIIALVVMFVILSGIKFFTAKVGVFAEPTVQLVIKPNPTISNSFMMMGEDTEENRERYEGTWYYEGKYKVITADELGFEGELIYNLLIVIWWISCMVIPIYILTLGVKLVRNPKIS